MEKILRAWHGHVIKVLLIRSRLTPMVIGIVKVSYTTAEVARVAGVDRQTLFRWLWAGKVPEPKQITFGGMSMRVWTAKELEQVKEYKKLHYRRRS